VPELGSSEVPDVHVVPNEVWGSSGSPQYPIWGQDVLVMHVPEYDSGGVGEDSFEDEARLSEASMGIGGRENVGVKMGTQGVECSNESLE
jgi:hypothetical protein